MRATIVMPIHNGASTLNQVFNYLELQNSKELIDSLILINDNSTDNSANLMLFYSLKSSYRCICVDSLRNGGLANNYNKGIKMAKTSLVITMHQDILLTDKSSFQKIINPFLTNENIGASFPTLLHPFKEWKSYGFWQKAMFSRFVGKQIPILTGKFDCFSISKLKKIGYFDSATYRTAGEDGDLKNRFQKLKIEMVPSGLKVIHLHSKERKFGIIKYLKKEAQLAESQGVNLRKYGGGKIKDFVLVFFRQILFIGLLIPFLNVVFIIFTVLYLIQYNRLTYLSNEKMSSKLILPFVDLLALPIATYFSVKGYLLKKQSL